MSLFETIIMSFAGYGLAAGIYHIHEIAKAIIERQRKTRELSCQRGE